MKSEENMPSFLRKYFVIRFRRNAVFALIALLLMTVSLFIMNSRTLSDFYTERPLPSSAYSWEIRLVIQEEQIGQLLFERFRFVSAMFSLFFFLPFLFFSCRSISLLCNLKCMPLSKMYRILKQFGNPSLLLSAFSNSLDTREKRHLKQRLLNKSVYIGKDFVVIPYPTHLYIVPTECTEEVKSV